MPPLSENSKLLIEALESGGKLDNRFENLKFVNYDSVNDEKRGCFSLVFRAHDCVNDQPVALKFYDIHPALFHDQYRQNSFQREHEILQTLIGKERCLQLVSAMSTYMLTTPTGVRGPVVTIPCRYFAVDWIDNQIDAFFLTQESFGAIEKLHLFNEIVLSVEALHRYEIFHRDLKPDNLRAYEEALKRIVIAIDLGTAARISSGYLQQSYGHSVGAPAYSSAESLSGLAPHRQLAPYTDIYALGCLLFELFNPGLFAQALISRNPKYQAVLVGMQMNIQGKKSEVEQRQAWCRAVETLSKGIAPVNIDGPVSTVPPGVTPLLNDLLARMTHINFANRPKNLEWVRRRVWSVIRCLENEKQYKQRLEFLREQRQRRVDNLKARERRILAAREVRRLTC